MAGQRWLIALPLAAILIVSLIIYVYYTNPQAAMKIRVKLDVEVFYLNSTGGAATFRIAPAANIGDPGGLVMSQRLIQYGVNGFYPVHTISTSGIVYVESRVVRNYTLGDFFEVWGQSLGPANTLGHAENFTSGSHWAMCLVNPSQGSPFPSFEWGSHILRDGEVIILFYSRASCA
jgi:hypothetical protein